MRLVKNLDNMGHIHIVFSCSFLFDEVHWLYVYPRICAFGIDWRLIKDGCEGVGCMKILGKGRAHSLEPSFKQERRSSILRVENIAMECRGT